MVEVEPLVFETEELRRPCYRLRIAAPGRERHELAQSVASAQQKARRDGAFLISTRIAADDNSAAAALGAAGFRCIERLVTLCRAIEPVPAVDTDVGLARPADADACIAIGRSSFSYDRFHADPFFDDTLADALKARWVENALNGRADAVLVARRGGRVCGFNLCMFADGVAIIDLIAVAEHARGYGLGAALIAGALRHYHGRAGFMRVGTQAVNAPSLSLYRSMGFDAVSEALTYHDTLRDEER